MEIKKVKAKVVMMEMPHKNYSWSHVVLNDHGTIMSYKDKKTRFDDRQGWYPQYLYFITDDEIKEGDWYILFGVDGTKIQYCDSKTDEIACFTIGSNNCKKVIATTDSSLKLYESETLAKASGFSLKTDDISLPQPSQEFIKKYCELGGIDEVMIEFTRDEKSMLNNIRTKGEESDWYIKTDSRNTITIHSAKDSWTREEVEALLYKHTEDMFNQRIFLEDWIRKNL